MAGLPSTLRDCLSRVNSLRDSDNLGGTGRMRFPDTGGLCSSELMQPAVPCFVLW